MSLYTILEELREFDTALLANTIGYIDPTPPHEYYLSRLIQSVTPSLGPTVGIAVTCELDSSSPALPPDLEGYWRQLEEISRMEEPAVWVVKTVGPRPDHECTMGDGMAKTLHAAGCVGVVTDGGVRDIPGLLSVPFAAYSHGKTIHHGGLRFRNMGCSVEIGGVLIHPGEVIHANNEGVIRIPSGCLDRLPSQAAQMRLFEQEAHGVLRRTDLPISDKRKQVGDLLRKFDFAK